MASLGRRRPQLVGERRRRRGDESIVLLATLRSARSSRRQEVEQSAPVEARLEEPKEVCFDWPGAASRRLMNVNGRRRRRPTLMETLMVGGWCLVSARAINHGARASAWVAEPREAAGVLALKLARSHSAELLTSRLK